MPLVSGVRRTTSAPMLSHGGSRLNASKPEANPKTRCPKKNNCICSYSLLLLSESSLLAACLRNVVQPKTLIESPFKKQETSSPSKAQSKTYDHKIYVYISDHHDASSHLPNAGCRTLTGTQKNKLRPSPNERTCMGWHERHASLRRGSRGTLRPEALNLEA